jgi:hypothetical protein
VGVFCELALIYLCTKGHLMIIIIIFYKISITYQKNDIPFVTQRLVALIRLSSSQTILVLPKETH